MFGTSDQREAELLEQVGAEVPNVDVDWRTTDVPQSERIAGREVSEAGR